MKTFAIATLLSIVSVVGAAGLCFFSVNSTSQTAGEELAAFKQHAQAAAENARIFPIPQGGHIVSMARPVISPTDRDQIAALEFRYKSLTRRRELAAWFITRGILAGFLVAGFCWFLTSRETRPVPEPARI